MAAETVAVCMIGPIGRGVVVSRRKRFGVRERIADVTRHRSAGAVVAALLDPAAQLLDRRRVGVELDRGRLRDRVCVDFEHTRPA
jgi:hypothetical protein